MPGEGQRFVSKHSGFRKVNTALLQPPKRLKKHPTFSAVEKYSQSIQNLRDRYDSKTGIRTVAATLLCARYWECVLCQHSASHSKLHIMLRNCFFPEFWKLLGKKKSIFLGLFFFFFLSLHPSLGVPHKINEVSRGRYLRGGTIWLTSVGKSDSNPEHPWTASTNTGSDPQTGTASSPCSADHDCSSTLNWPWKHGDTINTRPKGF